MKISNACFLISLIFLFSCGPRYITITGYKDINPRNPEEGIIYVYDGTFSYSKSHYIKVALFDADDTKTISKLEKYIARYSKFDTSGGSGYNFLMNSLFSSMRSREYTTGSLKEGDRKLFFAIQIENGIYQRVVTQKINVKIVRGEKIFFRVNGNYDTLDASISIVHPIKASEEMKYLKYDMYNPDGCCMR